MVVVGVGVQKKIPHLSQLDNENAAHIFRGEHGAARRGTRVSMLSSTEWERTLLLGSKTEIEGERETRERRKKNMNGKKGEVSEALRPDTGMSGMKMAFL